MAKVLASAVAGAHNDCGPSLEEELRRTLEAGKAARSEPQEQGNAPTATTSGGRPRAPSGLVLPQVDVDVNCLGPASESAGAGGQSAPASESNPSVPRRAVRFRGSGDGPLVEASSLGGTGPAAGPRRVNGAPSPHPRKWGLARSALASAGPRTPTSRPTTSEALGSRRRLSVEQEDLLKGMDEIRRRRRAQIQTRALVANVPLKTLARLDTESPLDTGMVAVQPDVLQRAVAAALGHVGEYGAQPTPITSAGVLAPGPGGVLRTFAGTVDLTIVAERGSAADAQVRWGEEDARRAPPQHQTVWQDARSWVEAHAGTAPFFNVRACLFLHVCILQGLVQSWPELERERSPLAELAHEYFLKFSGSPRAARVLDQAFARSMQLHRVRLGRGCHETLGHFIDLCERWNRSTAGTLVETLGHLGALVADLRAPPPTASAEMGSSSERSKHPTAACHLLDVLWPLEEEVAAALSGTPPAVARDQVAAIPLALARRLVMDVFGGQVPSETLTATMAELNRLPAPPSDPASESAREVNAKAQQRVDAGALVSFVIMKRKQADEQRRSSLFDLFDALEERAGAPPSLLAVHEALETLVEGVSLSTSTRIYSQALVYPQEEGSPSTVYGLGRSAFVDAAWALLRAGGAAAAGPGKALSPLEEAAMQRVLWHIVLDAIRVSHAPLHHLTALQQC